MPKFLVGATIRIEIPIIFEVIAKDDEAACEKADNLFSLISHKGNLEEFLDGLPKGAELGEDIELTVDVDSCD